MRLTYLSLVALVGCTGQLGIGGGGSIGRAPPPQPSPRPRPAPVAQPAAAGVQASAELSVSIQFYGVPLGGANDLVFVLDRSGSMAHDKMAHAKDELLRVLDQLPDGTRVGLVFFNTHVAEWTLASVVGGEAADTVGGGRGKRFMARLGAAAATKASGLERRLVPLSPMYRRQAHQFVGSIDARGNTAAVPALRAAATMGARHIVFLSDGLANTGGDGGELMMLTDELGRRGVRVDTIGLGADQDYQVLQQMAAATGGLAVVR